MRGRKTKFIVGREMGEHWNTILRMDKKYKGEKLQTDYKKMYRKIIKNKRPTRKNKITRQEFDTGFKLGFEKKKKEEEEKWFYL